MDIVLEVLDGVLFDRVYAKLLPASPDVVSISAAKHAAAAAARTVANATFSSMRELPTDVGYQYRPASQYLQVPPSEYAYLSAWPRDNIYRQLASVMFIGWVFGTVIYFLCATLSYIFVFDKTTFSHPRFLKNQIRQEIRQAMAAIPVMSILMAPAFVAETRGYAKMYDTPEEGPGQWYTYLQFPLFIIFTDFFIYWIHRGLHHPLIYKRLHKPHHKWIMPSPYASHAFHPLDGYCQALPYHIFPFLFPMQKVAFLALFVFINIWTIMIHDGEYVANSSIINGAACHTMHHLYFNYNYGQFTTLWDRLGGSYRPPNPELFVKETKMAKQEWDRQIREMEVVIREVEGKDDRHYDGNSSSKQEKKPEPEVVIESKKAR
ncbi:MAG: COPII coat Sec23p-Sfb3p heterodimer component [Watsoniomyces obsoletus]|nr:MAG: COPII coat Sec23p-Sfb3p heterodimer component [Watsoniomyces obsoletus]